MPMFFKWKLLASFHSFHVVEYLLWSQVNGPCGLSSTCHPMKLNARWVAGNLHNQLWKTPKNNENTPMDFLWIPRLWKGMANNPWCWLKSHVLSGKLYIVWVPDFSAHKDGTPKECHMSERCALEATQLRAVKSAQDAKGSLPGVWLQVKLFVFGQEVYIYMYRYAQEARIYVHIFTYTNIQI